MSGEVRVLVVDDDFMVAAIHTRFVEAVEGFVVVGRAATGAEALTAIGDLSPDLVLLDVHLPDLSGIEVLRRLRADGDDVGVVMVTAAREADTVRAAVAGGAAHYLVKPFQAEDLAARLRSFRQTRLGLTGAGPAAQDAIDAAFAPLDHPDRPARPGGEAGTDPRAALPKGLSPETAEAVLAVLADGEVSATEAAEAVGISRVSARRYLEHYVETGRATVRLRYGGGRPERRYRGA